MTHLVISKKKAMTMLTSTVLLGYYFFCEQQFEHQQSGYTFPPVFAALMVGVLDSCGLTHMV